MDLFNRGHAQGMYNMYEKGTRSSCSLTELFALFNLSTEVDGDAVFELLRNNAYYYGNITRENYQPWRWFVNFEGFKRLWTYAEDKEKLLDTFCRNYAKNYFEKHNEQAETKEENK